MTDWSQQPQEILELIAARLATHADLVRFRAVCRWWRSATVSSHPKFPDCIPFLFNPKPKPSSDCRRLFCPIEDHRYRLPFVPRLDRPKGWRCFGSSNGWILIANPHAEVRLLNPFTGARVSLPCLSTIPCIEFVFDRELWRRDTFCVNDRLSTTGTEMREFFVHKMALSLSTMTTMIIYDDNRELAHAKPGDRSWTSICTRFTSFDDVIYREAQEQFYAVSHYRSAIAIDIATGSFDEAAPSINDPTLFDTIKYLVDVPSVGLLEIVRFLLSNQTVDFKIYKLIAEEGMCTKWAPANRLDGWAIFLGNGSSMAKNCLETQGCMDNCIYFTEDSGFCSGVGRDNGIFNVQTRKFRPISRIGGAGSAPLWLERRCLN